MPIPTPSKDETKDKFIPRCMSSEVMQAEFPDSKQRFAVCSQKWRDKNKKSSAETTEKEIENGEERTNSQAS
jgi:hypothetical protein